MAQVQLHVLAVPALQTPAGFELGDHRPRDDVAGAELHSGRHVVFEEAVAILVQEEAALAAGGFRDEDARPGKAGRVVLRKLHIGKWRARPIGEPQAVTRIDEAVGRESPQAANAPGRENRCLTGEAAEFARPQVDGYDPATHAVVDQQPGGEVLVETSDALVPQALLEDRVEHVEAGLVSREHGAVDAHAAKGADGDRSVGLPAPGAAPVLELDQLVGRFVGKVFDDILIGNVVAALDGVEGMELDAVAGVPADDGGGAPLSGHGMAAHRIDLGDEGDAAAFLGCRNRGP